MDPDKEDQDLGDLEVDPEEEGLVVMMDQEGPDQTMMENWEDRTEVAVIGVVISEDRGEEKNALEEARLPLVLDRARVAQAVIPGKLRSVASMSKITYIWTDILLVAGTLSLP